VHRRDFQLLGYCFLMHKSSQGALSSFAKHESHQRETIDSNAIGDEQKSPNVQRQSRFPTMREKELQVFRKLLRFVSYLVSLIIITDIVLLCSV
jgi:hypothetical protein